MSQEGFARYKGREADEDTADLEKILEASDFWSLEIRPFLTMV